MKIISLFANIGVAEAYLSEIGFEVLLANELLERRASLYKKIYPTTKMISGSILDKKVFNSLVTESKKLKIDIVMATPPCQGMSTAGQQKKDDHRNNLILPTIEFIKNVNPKYVFIENVPQFLNTKIKFRTKEVLIIDLLKSELEGIYNFSINLADPKDYSVPQTRERAIILLSKKTLKKQWTLPEKHKEIITLKDAIGDLPPLDPYIKDISEKELLKIFPKFFEKKDKALKISQWHNPPKHVLRQVITMMHTPTGKSAFNNTNFKPKKEDGTLIKGFPNTYKRQNWNSPAYAVTMDNVKISSQDNVHPGRPLLDSKNKKTLYSDPRVLTLYELMLVMSLPKDWALPKNESEAFIRRIIGEGIPPLFVKEIFLNLK